MSLSAGPSGDGMVACRRLCSVGALASNVYVEGYDLLCGTNAQAVKPRQARSMMVMTSRVGQTKNARRGL